MNNNHPHAVHNPPLRQRMTEIARDFRNEPTRSESILWQALRGKKLDGIKFRRQQPVGPFIVDFCNSVYRLVIEIDRPIHDSRCEAEKNRQSVLEDPGLTALRLQADLVERDLSAALEMIRMKIDELESQTDKLPPPDLGEGKGEG